MMFSDLFIFKYIIDIIIYIFIKIQMFYIFDILEY